MDYPRLFYSRRSSSYLSIIIFKRSDTINRYFIKFSYDGSKFNGYQKQKNKKTIQNELESILTKINSNKKVSVIASGRTDKGVHAFNQTAHFDLDKTISNNLLKDKLNKMIDKNICIKEVKKLNNKFHARFDCIKKEYLYKINIDEYNPIEKDYIYQYNKDINIKLLKEASLKLIGKHDFSGFAKDNKNKDNIRKIYKIKINKKDNIITITFIGNGFLRYMIRNIIGTLLDINENKKTKEDIDLILKTKDRTKAGITVLPNGLYLKNVFYK